MKDICKALNDNISLSGHGLFSGILANLKLKPATSPGIFFQRTDLPTAPIIEATLKYVDISAIRHTVLNKDGVVVETPEHILSALYGLNIDNVKIELDGPEVPIFDGSATIFVEALKKVATIDFQKDFYTISAPIALQEEKSLMIALPSDRLTISCLLDYKGVACLQNQLFSLDITDESYMQSLAKARTFATKEALLTLKQAGFFKNSTGDEGIIIADGKPSKPLHYPDEFVRHKIVDLLGDLSLLQKRLKMHIIAVRPGHRINIAFAKKLQPTIEPVYSAINS